MRSVARLLSHSSPRDTRKRKLTAQKGMMVLLTEQNQGVGEILRSLKISFLQLYNRFLLQGSTQRLTFVGKLPIKHDPLKFGQEKQEYSFNGGN